MCINVYIMRTLITSLLLVASPAEVSSIFRKQDLTREQVMSALKDGIEDKAEESK